LPDTRWQTRGTTASGWLVLFAVWNLRRETQTGESNGDYFRLVKQAATEGERAILLR